MSKDLVRRIHEGAPVMAPNHPAGPRRMMEVKPQALDMFIQVSLNMSAIA